MTRLGNDITSTVKRREGCRFSQSIRDTRTENLYEIDLLNTWRDPPYCTDSASVLTEPHWTDLDRQLSLNPDLHLCWLWPWFEPLTMADAVAATHDQVEVNRIKLIHLPFFLSFFKTIFNQLHNWQTLLTLLTSISTRIFVQWRVAYIFQLLLKEWAFKNYCGHLFVAPLKPMDIICEYSKYHERMFKNFFLYLVLYRQTHANKWFHLFFFLE